MKSAAWNAGLESERLLADMAWLRRLARGLVGDVEGGDDLAQETWAVLLTKTRRPVSLRPYLAGIARRLFLERRRGDGRRAARERVVGESRREALAPRPEASLERIELQEALLEAMRGLSPEQRDVLVLRYLDDLSPAEIAERRGVPAATVRSQLSRGLAALRERLDAKTPGGREAWLSALLPFLPAPAVSAGATGATTIGIGALAMKTLLSVSVVLLSVFALRTTLRAPGDEPAEALLSPSHEGETLARRTTPGPDEPGPTTRLEDAGGLAIPSRSAGRAAAAMRQERGGFRGSVVTLSGRPVVGATVDLLGLTELVTTEQVYGGDVDPEEPPGGVTPLGSVETGSNGRFEFSPVMDAAHYACFELCVDAPRHGTSYRFLAELPAEPYRFVLGGEPALGTIRGVVRDEHGVPIDDFTVEVSIPEDARLCAGSAPARAAEDEVGPWPSFPTQVFTRSGGLFQRSVPLQVSAWDRFRVTVRAEGFSADAHELSTRGFQSNQELQFELRRGRVFRARVEDSAGLPIAGASVRVLNLRRERSSQAPASYSSFQVSGSTTQTDEAGRFELVAEGPLGVTAEGLETGEELDSIEVEADGYGPRALRVDELEFDAGEQVIVLRRAGVVHGVVHGARDRSDLVVVARRAPVGASLFSGAPEVGRATVAAGGAYTLEGLAPGDLYLTLVAGTAPLTAEVHRILEPGDGLRVDLQADEWGALTGRVTLDLAGSALEGTVPSDQLGLVVALGAPGESGPCILAAQAITNGETFRLPSVATVPAGGFLRVAVNDTWYLDFPVEGLGGDLDLGWLRPRLTDFVVAPAAPGAPEDAPLPQR